MNEKYVYNYGDFLSCRLLHSTTACTRHTKPVYEGRIFCVKNFDVYKFRRVWLLVFENILTQKIYHTKYFLPKNFPIYGII